MTDNNPSIFLRRKPVVLRTVLISLLCTVLAVVTPVVFRVMVENGGYSIKSITLSRDLNWDTNQPVDVTDLFIPSDTIYCTVRTSGANRMIGARIYLGDNLIDEHSSKTEDNVVTFHFSSSKYVAIPEGKYRIEVYQADESHKNEAPKIAEFEVKRHSPLVQPPIPIPEKHKNIDVPKYTEVPFAFDEVWKINATEWKVNEVKVVLLDETQGSIVAVVINTDMSDLASISESVAKTRTRPIALYAMENGYIKKAESLAIDGINYDFDENIFIILRNPANQSVVWVEFLLDELK